MGALVLPFVAIGPIANSLDDNPVNFSALRSRVEARALHFSANCFRRQFEQLIPKVLIINEFFSRKDQSKFHLRSLPIQLTTSEAVEQSYRSLRAITAE